jgi:hypothetical protein
MAGQPTFSTAGAYSANPAPGASPRAGGGPSSTAFIIWVVLIGVILPGLILGGLRVGGFSFVFKGR